jgi:hypothetical protein
MRRRCRACIIVMRRVVQESSQEEDGAALPSVLGANRCAQVGTEPPVEAAQNVCGILRIAGRVALRCGSRSPHVPSRAHTRSATESTQATGAKEASMEAVKAHATGIGCAYGRARGEL